MIAGYDPKDELTVFSVGRMPSQPYHELRAETPLDGMRIGVVREYMDKKLFTQGGRADDRHRRSRAAAICAKLGATIVDPGRKATCSRVPATLHPADGQQAVHEALSGACFRSTRTASPRTDHTAQAARHDDVDPSLVPATSRCATSGRLGREARTST